MGSQQHPFPSGSATLEAKIDSLAHSLDVLLGRGHGGCPVCLTCSAHIHLHEAAERQLAAHSRLLEKLEKRTWEIQKTLEGRAKVKDDLEEKHHCTNQGTTQQMSVNPKSQEAITTKTTALPATIPHVNVKSSAPQPETSKQQRIKPAAPAVPPEKGSGAEQRSLQGVVTNPKPIGRGTPVDQPQPALKSTPSAPVNQNINSTLATGKSDTHNVQWTTRQKDLKQAAVYTPSKRGEGAASGAPVISGNSQEVKGQPMAEPSIQTEKLEIAERAEAAVVVRSAATGPTSQSKVGHTKPAVMMTSLPAPQKACRLAVPMVTMENPPLRHISSCPESLQRLQGLGHQATVQPVEPAERPAQGKTAMRGSSPGPGPDCGIQIRVFPAAQDKTRTPSLPTICHKVIDDVPPQPAPFPHRCVSLRSDPASDHFLIHTRDVLGGGRFGKVHRCTERSSGLKLAAKIINTRNAKEKETALNEMQVMNQLSHANILQLYEAFETRNQVILILEYVEGGELFDRIVDESAPLTEVDAMVFVKQICEGLHYMHQMYVLHLDLKPENILCVNRTSHQVKIIDFGLARRYRPREKLRVNFGTPEFLAPEVVNFDFVSFPTDMWTLGVVTYMLVSGMSPFLGDDDSQTLSNVLAVDWYFDKEAFEHVSTEARDFIGNLLIREKGGRLSAAQCLKHPWLNNISDKAKHNNIVLKSQVLLKKYMAKRLWKKNYIAIAAANRLKKISSSGCLTSLGV